MSALSSIVRPYIDPHVQHVGVSKLRSLSASKLSNIKSALVIQDNDTPLAVLVKYEEYLILQNRLMSLLETIEILTDPNERAELEAGIKDAREGKVTNLSEIRSGLAKGTHPPKPK